MIVELCQARPDSRSGWSGHRTTARRAAARIAAPDGELEPVTASGRLHTGGRGREAGGGCGIDSKKLMSQD
jgi:hypothetical protein